MRIEARSGASGVSGKRSLPSRASSMASAGFSSFTARSRFMRDCSSAAAPPVGAGLGATAGEGGDDDASGNQELASGVADSTATTTGGGLDGWPLSDVQSGSELHDRAAKIPTITIAA